MAMAILAMVAGLALLVWSADRFVEGSASAARHFGMPPLLIGMVIVGFGTSAPELIVSALAAGRASCGIALGNAYGSNTTNIALILGITALVSPVIVHSSVLRKELPVLTAVTALAAWQLCDGMVSRFDAAALLALFAGLMMWTVRQGCAVKADELGSEMTRELQLRAMPVRRALFWMAAGLAALIVSSRVLVWGAVEISRGFGISDLVVGLTIVAAGTSLPELASSVMAAVKGEHDIALGNILGSNLFNTLAVVGVAGMIRPLRVDAGILSRDIPAMALATVSLFLLCYGFRGRQGRINRMEGSALLAAYLAYVLWLIVSARGPS